MQREADTVGFYDLLDAATGDVVYTVAKETDFASNMYHGAFTQSGFARVVQRALDPRKRAPKLLFDIVRFGLSVTWGSVVVSSIWNVNLLPTKRFSTISTLPIPFQAPVLLRAIPNGLTRFGSTTFADSPASVALFGETP